MSASDPTLEPIQELIWSSSSIPTWEPIQFPSEPLWSGIDCSDAPPCPASRVPDVPGPVGRESRAAAGRGGAAAARPVEGPEQVKAALRVSQVLAGSEGVSGLVHWRCLAVFSCETESEVGVCLLYVRHWSWSTHPTHPSGISRRVLLRLSLEPERRFWRLHDVGGSIPPCFRGKHDLF